MTSLLHELAYRIRCVGEDLPVGQVSTAADRLRSARHLLAWVTRSSAAPAPLPELSTAGYHLDHAAAAMLAAREALGGYLLAIGLPGDGVPPPARAERGPSDPAPDSPAPSELARITDALRQAGGRAR